MVVHDSSPNEPAVTPTDKKNPNSIRSLEPGGMLFSIVCSIIMPLQIQDHLLRQELCL